MKSDLMVHQVRIDVGSPPRSSFICSLPKTGQPRLSSPRHSYRCPARSRAGGSDRGGTLPGCRWLAGLRCGGASCSDWQCRHSSLPLVIDGLPRGEVRRKHTPLAAGLVDIKDGIHYQIFFIICHCSSVRSVGYCVITLLFGTFKDITFFQLTG